MITHRINQAIKGLKLVLPEINNLWTDKIVQKIKSYYISRAILNKALDKDTYDIISMDDVSRILVKDIFSSIMVMRNTVREDSHGASVPSIIFVSNQVYNNIVGSLGLKPEITCIINQTMVVSSDFLEDNIAYLFCIPKFDEVAYQKLVYLVVVGD